MAEYRIYNAENEGINNTHVKFTSEPIDGLYWEISRLEDQAQADSNLNWEYTDQWAHDKQTELTNTPWTVEDIEDLISQIKELQKKIEKDDDVTWEPYDQRHIISFPNDDKIAVLPEEVLKKLKRIRDALTRRIEANILRAQWGELSIAEPLIKKGENRVKPAIVDTMEITSTGNSQRHVDLCGNVMNEKINDNEWKATLEGVITHGQLESLKKMSPADGSVELISDMHNANVEFDRFTVTQTSDLNKGWTAEAKEQSPYDGQNTVPLYQFQLQTRDKEN